jgi:hypothetical protein
METDNLNQVSPADIQRAKDNEKVSNDILTNAEKRADDAKTNVNQEPILVTETTKPILARQGITNVITQEELDARDKNLENDDSKAKVINTIKASEKSASDEGQQVKKAEVNTESKENIDLSDEEYGALERAGITEEQILASDGTFAQIKELAQTQLKKEQGEGTAINKIDDKPSQDLSSMVISEEYATELALTYPFAKSLVGKTMEDAMKIISKQNQYITGLENSTGKVENKTDIDKTNSQNDNSDLGISQDEVIDLLNLTPEKATEAIKSLMLKTAESVTAEQVAKEVKKLLPNLEVIQQQSNESIEKQFYSALGDQLPKDVDPIQVVVDWKKVNANMPKKSKQSLIDNVELLITTISDSYKLGKLSKENTNLVNSQNSEVKKQTFNKLKELIIKSKSLGVHNGQFNFKRKEMIDITGEPQNATESLLDPIIKRNLNR